MDDILLSLHFDMEDLSSLKEKLNKYSFNKFKNMIDLFNKYNLSNPVIREIILNKDYVFDYDIDRVKFIFDAIVSNNDIIEETILELL